MDNENSDEWVSIEEYEKWKRIFFVVLFVVSIVSGWMTFRGLTAFTEKSVAAVLALISFVLAYCCWSFACEFAPRAGKRAQGQLLVSVVYPTIVLVALTSTSLGWMGLAVPESERLAMVTMVDEGAQVLQKLERQRASEAAVLPALSVQAEEWSAMSADERRHGRFFKRGRGKITGDLEAIGRAYRSAHETLEKDRQRFEEAGRKAEAALQSMRRIADEASASTGAMSEASAKFSTQLYRFDEALGVMSVSSLDTALRGIDSAMSQQRNAPLLSRGDKRRAREKEATRQITKMAEDARASVLETLREVDAGPVEVPLMRMPLATEALGEHLLAVAHLGAYPIAIDAFLPLTCLLAMSYLRRRLPRGGRGSVAGEHGAPGSGALPRAPHGRKEVRGDHPSAQAPVPGLEEAVARLRRGRQAA